MTKHSEEMGQRPEKQDASDVVVARRRRLLTAGASSPLLMTIASRPAWANGGVCTPSALASANASGGHDFVGCSLSASWWGQFKDRWPIPDATLFHSIFWPVKYKGAILYEGMSLGDVIDLRDGNDPMRGTFGFHLIGAYLNALQFPPDRGVPGYAFTPQQVVSFYNALAGVDMRTADNKFDAINSGDDKGQGQEGQESQDVVGSMADIRFQALAATLEDANNQFASATEKPR